MRYLIKYHCATFRDIEESEKNLSEITEELRTGWVHIGNKVINASMIEQIVEVNEEEKDE